MQRSNFPLRVFLWLILIGVLGQVDASSIEHNPIDIKEWHVPYEGQPQLAITWHVLIHQQKNSSSMIWMIVLVHTI